MPYRVHEVMVLGEQCPSAVNKEITAWPWHPPPPPSVIHNLTFVFSTPSLISLLSSQGSEISNYRSLRVKAVCTDLFLRFLWTLQLSCLVTQTHWAVGQSVLPLICSACWTTSLGAGRSVVPWPGGFFFTLPCPVQHVGQMCVEWTGSVRAVTCS
jgi:hypothetical protein